MFFFRASFSFEYSFFFRALGFSLEHQVFFRAFFSFEHSFLSITGAGFSLEHPFLLSVTGASFSLSITYFFRASFSFEHYGCKFSFRASTAGFLLSSNGVGFPVQHQENNFLVGFLWCSLSSLFILKGNSFSFEPLRVTLFFFFSVSWALSLLEGLDAHCHWLKCFFLKVFLATGFPFDGFLDARDKRFSFRWI